MDPNKNFYAKKRKSKRGGVKVVFVKALFSDVFVVGYHISYTNQQANKNVRFL
jgi:hypothetical protein